MESELADSAQNCACSAQQSRVSLLFVCLPRCPLTPPLPTPHSKLHADGDHHHSFLEVYHASTIFLGLRVSFCVEAGGFCGKLSLVPGRLSHLKDAKRLLGKNERPCEVAPKLYLHCKEYSHLTFPLSLLTLKSGQWAGVSLLPALWGPSGTLTWDWVRAARFCPLA